MGGLEVTTTDHGRLTLRAIEVFVAVIEEGSIATGARRLGASPSSVSQQLGNLETALGATLLDRSARPVALTPAGCVFQRLALAILDEASRAQSELAELELSRLPQLRLAVIEELEAEVTPALTLSLSESLPDCNIVAHSGPSDRNIAALEAWSVDLIVAAEFDGASEWIEQRPLLRDPYVLVTSRDLALDDANLVDGLMAAPMVRYAEHQLMGRQIEAHLRRLRLAPPRRFEFDGDHAVMATVAASGGWTIATPLGFLSAAQFHRDLVLRPLPFQGLTRTLSLYSRRDVLGGLPERAAAALRDLIDRKCVARAIEIAPWLSGQFCILGDGASLTA